MLASVFILALFLRLFRLDEYPAKGEILDEYYWTFLGTSLIENHKPTSWSYFDYPSKVNRNIAGYAFQIASPNMDLPPLFSFIPGFLQVISNRTWDNPVSLFALRIPMVILGMVNLSLFYILSKKIFSLDFSLLAVALYASTPSVVFGSRLVVSDNLLITFMLGLLFILISNKNNYVSKVVTFLTGAACLLTKLQGIAILIAFLFFSWESRKKYFVYMLLGTLMGIVILFFYAWYFGLNTFINILYQQATYRVIGFASFPLLFLLKPMITDAIFLDGVILSGTISLFAMMLYPKKESWMRIISLFSLIYILVLCFTAGEVTRFPAVHTVFTGQSINGWYKFPLYPAMIISLTWILEEIYKNYNKIGFALLSLFFVMQFRLFIFQVTDLTLENGIPKIIVRLTFLALGATILLPRTWWRKAFLAGVLLTILLSSLVVINIHAAKVFADTDYLLLH